jgi:hypothetical protein
MAMASKINIAPLAIVLPAAFVLRFLIQKKERGESLTDHWCLNTDYWTLVILCLIGGGIATIISFRIFQPYAFNGVGLDPRWVADLRARAQAGDHRRGICNGRGVHLYSFTLNSSGDWVFRLASPPGRVSFMGWRIIKGMASRAARRLDCNLLSLQSLQFNLDALSVPIYPC